MYKNGTIPLFMTLSIFVLPTLRVALGLHGIDHSSFDWLEFPPSFFFSNHTDSFGFLLCSLSFLQNQWPSPSHIFLLLHMFSVTSLRHEKPAWQKALVCHLKLGAPLHLLLTCADLLLWSQKNSVICYRGVGYFCRSYTLW